MRNSKPKAAIMAAIKIDSVNLFFLVSLKKWRGDLQGEEICFTNCWETHSKLEYLMEALALFI